jgi:hypothetical protein
MAKKIKIDDLFVLQRVENTSIQPKVFNILLLCTAKICSKATKNGSHDRYRGAKKCCYCPNADLYTALNSRYDNGEPVRLTKYTKGTLDSISNAILSGRIHNQFLTVVTEEKK